MTTRDKPLDAGRVACEVCLKEVPVSEAKVAEATDYVVHFCGLDCYEKWKGPRIESDNTAAKPGSR
jgi:hypothetical protein